LLRWELKLLDFLRTVRMALPTLDGWLMLLAFRSLSLYLGIAIWSSGSLPITRISFWSMASLVVTYEWWSIDRKSLFLIDHGEYKRLLKLESCCGCEIHVTFK
jgi:hypothetical protein